MPDDLDDFIRDAHAEGDDPSLDDVSCEHMVTLITAIKAFASRFAAHDLKRDQGLDVVEDLVVEMNLQTVRFIGCIAQSGRTHIHGWRDLLTDRACREAIVVGIIGRVLKEYVFGVPFFGATEEFLNELAEGDEAQEHLDGKCGRAEVVVLID